jgi:hypothetical protein
MSNYFGDLVDGAAERLETIGVPHCARVLPVLDGVYPISINSKNVDLTKVPTDRVPVCMFSLEDVGEQIEIQALVEGEGQFTQVVSMPRYPNTMCSAVREKTGELVMRPLAIFVPSEDDKALGLPRSEEAIAHEAEHFRHFSESKFILNAPDDPNPNLVEFRLYTAAERLAYRVSYSMLAEREIYPTSQQMLRAVSKAIPKQNVYYTDTLDAGLLCGIKEYLQRLRSNPGNMPKVDYFAPSIAALPPEPLVVALAEQFGGYDDDADPMEVSTELVYMYKRLGVLKGLNSKLESTGASLLDIALFSQQSRYTVESLHAAVDSLDL